jgi:hypothetical protein
VVSINLWAILIGVMLFIGWIITVASFLPETQFWAMKSAPEKVAYIMAVVVLPVTSTFVTFYFIGEFIVSLFVK